MSIINDALKKVQQGLNPKADETSTAPAAPSQNTENIFSSTENPKPPMSLPIEKLPAAKNKARSVLILICSIAFALGAVALLCKQLNVYFPRIQRAVKSSYYKLIHKEEIPEFKTKTAKDLVPLAKITVNPAKPISPAPSQAPVSAANQQPMTYATDPNIHGTLNVHGVLANPTGNVVLINDQVYQEGDDVDGVKIVKINLNSIQINNNGQEETIRVKS
jgi:hypothetical protein